MKIKDHKGHIKAETFDIAICDQKGCPFFGLQKVQGVCFSAEPFVPKMSYKYIEQISEAAEEYMKESRDMYKKYSNKDCIDYIDYLESHSISSWVDRIIYLDELVLLRRQNSLLKLELDKLKNVKAPKTKAGKL